MASVGTLRPSGLRRRLTRALGFSMPPNFIHAVKLSLFTLAVALGSVEGMARTVNPNSGTVAICQVVVNTHTTDVHGKLFPAGQLHDYFLPMQVIGPSEEIDVANATVEVIRAPARGKLGASPLFQYQPNAGFLGKDSVTFRVKTTANQEAVDYKVLFHIHVVQPMKPMDFNLASKKLCPSPGAWRVR